MNNNTKKIIVEKRDGTKEEWSDDKSLTSLIRAGLSIEDSKLALRNIKESIPGGTIKSENIKNAVVSYLRDNFPEEAVIYENYKK